MNQARALSGRPFAVFLYLFFSCAKQAKEIQPGSACQAFGVLSNIWPLSISLDGTRLAMLRQKDAETILVVIDSSSQTVFGAIKGGELKVRSVLYVNNHLLLIRASHWSNCRHGFR